ncbi:MAG TPA: BlaI/MecI/CopY family transcriptional regulator [Chthoniobacteraceae bacterium]|nr:BlaI/MecI/CopY family transcriptional regulator [Chthoniobacteraceae bacterium]
MQTPPHLSEAEWQVMRAIWSRTPPSTAQEIVDDLAGATAWSPATIKTMLNRLVRKGALRFEKEGRAYLYTAAFPEEAHRKVASRGFLQRIFDGSLTPMIAHFLETHRLSEEEIGEIEALLEEKKAKRKPRP